MTTLKKNDNDDSKDLSSIEKSVTGNEPRLSTAEEILLDESNLVKNYTSGANQRVEALRNSAFNKSNNKTFSSMKYSKQDSPSSGSKTYIQMNAKLNNSYQKP